MVRISGKPVVAPVTNWFQRHRDAHRESDVDSGPRALHHRLGFGAGQAAPGLDVRSKLIGEWVTIELADLSGTWTYTPGVADKGETPQYRIVNGTIELRGRVDNTVTFTNATNLITTLPVTRTYTESQWAVSASNQTAGSGAAAITPVPVRMDTGGNLIVVVNAAITAQRWLHLGGLRYDIVIDEGI